MRRSSKISLALLSSISVFALTACEENPQDEMSSYFFETPQQCESTFDQATCQQAEAESVKAYQETAPTYVNQEDCEAAQGAGACTPQTTSTGTGTGMFMPLMAGYFIGSMMNRGGGAFSSPNAKTGPYYGSTSNPRSGKSADVRLNTPPRASSSIAPRSTRQGFGTTGTRSSNRSQSFGG